MHDHGSRGWRDLVTGLIPAGKGNRRVLKDSRNRCALQPIFIWSFNSRALRFAVDLRETGFPPKEAMFFK